MKKMFLLVASFGILSSLVAQTTDDRDPNDLSYHKKTVYTAHFQSPPGEGLSAGPEADKYCASIVGGKMAVIYKGKAIMDNVTLSNGTLIFKEGTVVSSQGLEHTLKKGECVDKNGDNM